MILAHSDRTVSLILRTACVAVLLVLAGGLLIPGVGADASMASGPDTVEHDQSTGTAIESEVLNASGEVELILYLDSLSPEEIRAADDPIARMQSHSQSTQPDVRFALNQDDAIDVQSSSWLANSLLISVDLDNHSIDKIAAIDGVKRIGENAEVTTLEASEARSGFEQPATMGTDSTYGLTQISAPEAWETYDTQGAGVRVAVVDTGVDVAHPDIDLYTEDPNDPTYPGGWAEFDATGTQIDNSVPYDTGQHGTHVSGTVAGGDASGTHIGVAPEVELMHALGIDATDGGTTAQVIASVEWVLENDADIVNLSLGATGAVPADARWVRNAKATGVHVVAASGNRGPRTISSPAAVPDAVSVGASEQDGIIAPFSSGERVQTSTTWGGATSQGWPDSYVIPDVAAPGADVVSAVPDNEYAQSSGTSMAAPHVSGALALMIAASDDPDLTPVAYERALFDTATKPVGSPARQDTRYGHGTITVPAAIEQLSAYDGGAYGTVTDSDGQRLSDVDIGTDSSIRTFTDASGEYAVNDTVGSTTLTATKFGYHTERRSLTIPDQGGTRADITLDSTTEAMILSETPPFAESGSAYTTALRFGNVDTYTVELAEDSTVDPDTIDIALGDTTIELGERVTFGSTIEDTVGAVTVQTDPAIDAETITLDHTVAGDDTSHTFSTRTTTVKSDPGPGRVAVTNFHTTDRIAEGDSVHINATVENVGERTTTQAIDYTVVSDQSTVGTEIDTLTLEPGETAQVEQVIGADALTPGSYTQRVESANDSASQSITVVERGTVSVALEPTVVETVSDTDHAFDIVISDPFDGIDSYDITLLSNNSNVAPITAVEPNRSAGTGATVITDNGSVATFERELGSESYAPASEVRLGTVVVRSDEPGEAMVSIDDDSLITDRDGSQYAVQTTDTAVVRVDSSPDGIDVTGDGTVAADTTGDGKFNDINGDGSFTIADVQLFFEHRDSEAVQQNPDKFDFSGNGRVGIGDVQSLFTQLRG